MATLFTDIFSKFTKITIDTEISKLTNDEIEEILIDYLEYSLCIEFKECVKNLEDVDMILKQFNDTLSKEEQYIIVHGMVLRYFDSKLNYEELVMDAISDRDYKKSSKSNQLPSLLKLKASSEEKMHNLIMSYTGTDENFDSLG